MKGKKRESVDEKTVFMSGRLRTLNTWFTFRTSMREVWNEKVR